MRESEIILLSQHSARLRGRANDHRLNLNSSLRDKAIGSRRYDDGRGTRCIAHEKHTVVTMQTVARLDYTSAEFARKRDGGRSARRYCDDELQGVAVKLPMRADVAEHRLVRGRCEMNVADDLGMDPDTLAAGTRNR